MCCIVFFLQHKLTYSIKFGLGTADIVISLICFDFVTISFTCLFFSFIVTCTATVWQLQIICQNLITNYIFTRPIINSRGRLYIQEADYIFLMALSDWSIQRIETIIIIQKIKVKTSGYANAKHLITYS